MIVGDQARLAIESRITRAYEGRGLLALGFFLIHVAGVEYGVRAPDASMLANSFDSVMERIQRRGFHTAYFSLAPAVKIAETFLDVIYGDPRMSDCFGRSPESFLDAVESAAITWAPDGDAAFDDGSYVLQFDIEDKVRLIAFKSGDEGRVESLSEVVVESEKFYKLLSDWSEAFEREWKATPKSEYS